MFTGLRQLWCSLPLLPVRCDLRKYRDSGSSGLAMTKPTDLKSAGHSAVPSAVQMVAGVLKNTPKRSAINLIAQQHTQNWIDS
jgi:hypothetical protein